MIRRALGALLCAMAMQSAHAQDDTERCIFDNTPQTRQRNVLQPSGQYNSFLGNGVIARCPKKNLRLRADSLESYGDDGRLYLVGNVHYDEPRMSVTSKTLTYQQRFERIVATGDVVATLPSGSTIRGPVLDYFRSIPTSRPYTRVVATQRPTIKIVQKDSTGAPADTLTVLANSVNMIGDSLVYAAGAVVLTRPDLEAKGDSLFLDSVQELMVLMRGPSIAGRGDKPFTLTGIRIEVTSANRKLDRVLALGSGKAVSEDMTLTSDTIDLRIANDLLDRAIAFGPGRAKVVSATQQIVADSIDVRMPGQRVRELHALRGAVAEAQPDTMRYRADTVDWMRGDTIIALFDTAATKDSSKTAVIRELLARGSARSRYHMQPSDTSARKAAINYVTGRRIAVAFEQRRAKEVTVTGRSSGLFLDPKPEPKPAATKTQSPTNGTKAPATKAAPPATKSATQTKSTPPATKPPQ